MIFTIFMLTSLFSLSQYQPKRIKAKGNFIHNATKCTFPLMIYGYNRIGVYAFDRKRLNIGVTYKSVKSVGKTTFTLYVYPAGDGTEDRLRDEYLKSILSIANVSNDGIHAKQHYISFTNSGYKINGFKAEIKDFKANSSLSVFECARWFFKIRITSNNLDSNELIKLEQKILDFFVPTRLVHTAPLKPKADISFAKTAFVDSLMLGSAMGSALKKLEWAIENVDSLERASGFPGLYLEMHIAALKEFVEFEKKHPDFYKTKRTADYLSEMNSIINSGFLEELIMEQFNMIMIIPDNLKLDFDGFDRWKKLNPININLNERFYVIYFSQ